MPVQKTGAIFLTGCFAILRHYGNLTARLGSDAAYGAMLATHVIDDEPLDEVLALADGSQYAPEPLFQPMERKPLPMPRHAAAGAGR